MDENFQPGTTSYNFNSLGINDFIDNCMGKIKSFQDIKRKVDEKIAKIEDIVNSIESAQILRPFNFVSVLEDNNNEELSL